MTEKSPGTVKMSSDFYGIPLMLETGVSTYVNALLHSLCSLCHIHIGDTECFFCFVINCLVVGFFFCFVFGVWLFFFT